MAATKEESQSTDTIMQQLIDELPKRIFNTKARKEIKVEYSDIIEKTHGLSFGQKVTTPKGDAIFFGTSGGNLQFLVSNDQGLSYWDDFTGHIKDYTKITTLGVILTGDEMKEHIKKISSLIPQTITSDNAYHYDFSNKKLIGSGSYANVYLVIEKKTQKKFAAKKIENRDSKERTILETLNQYIEKTPQNGINIIPYFEPVTHDRDLYLILEFAVNGTVLDWVHANTVSVSYWNTVYGMMKGALSGLRFLHESTNIAHLDMKPDNLLLTDLLQIKICDFGLAQTMETYILKVGTPLYAAPEMLNTWKSSEEIKVTEGLDIFAAGMTFFAMVSQCLPGNNITDINELIEFRNNHEEKLPGECPVYISKVIYAMWNKNHQKRVSAKDAYAMLEDSDQNNNSNALKSM